MLPTHTPILLSWLSLQLHLLPPGTWALKAVSNTAMLWGRGLQSHAPCPRPSSRSVSELPRPLESPPTRPASPSPPASLPQPHGVHLQGTRTRRERLSRGPGLALASGREGLFRTSLSLVWTCEGRGTGRKTKVLCLDSVPQGHVWWCLDTWPLARKSPGRVRCPAERPRGTTLLLLPHEDTEGMASLWSCEAAAPEDISTTTGNPEPPTQEPKQTVETADGGPRARGLQQP